MAILRSLINCCVLLSITYCCCFLDLASASIVDDKPQLKAAVVEMFDHAWNSYMEYAHPADELMPLSCTGRVRGVTQSRGDIDDALGHFSLTLVDSLDSLFMLGKMRHFEDAIRFVISDVNFDTDVVVSVFETNIRMLGGLLSGHILAKHAQKTGQGLTWYSDQLLKKAEDLGHRLLVAYSSTTGLPHPRVNLRYGLHGVPSERTTCTACAGSVLLEMATLSRLTGNPIFEEKARRATSALWDRRNRYTNLVGSIMNIDNGEWIRSDSGVGAGSDSYYEYLLKAYILLGDVDSYHRFAQHYDAIMKYQMRQGFLVDVPMHSPHSSSRNVVDALSAFWPGLQTLIGDLPSAIKTHEMLYALVRKYRFLPEAVSLNDYRTHWAHHPLRPEFIESTYFLYRATKDPHYLEVGREVLSVLNSTVRVKCGFAAIHDINSMQLSDQMDSYLLAETFKYLYLLFSESSDLPIDVDNFVFTTEGHLLPLSLSSNFEDVHLTSESKMLYSRVNSTTCPNHVVIHNEDIPAWASRMRAQTRASYPALGKVVATAGLSPAFSRFTPGYQEPVVTTASIKPLIKAADFDPDNSEHVKIVKRMGLVLVVNNDGRAQLWHRPETAESVELSAAGLVFMREMLVLQSQAQQNQNGQCASSPPQYRAIQMWLLSAPFCGNITYHAGPAQFGVDLEKADEIVAKLVRTPTDDGCVAGYDSIDYNNGIAITRRGGCTFAEKARVADSGGAAALIIVDSEVGTTQERTPFFALSADSGDEISIPVAFLFHKEGEQLLKLLERPSTTDGDLTVMLWRQPENTELEEKKIQKNWSIYCNDF